MNNVPVLADCLKYADETKDLILQKEALPEIPGLLSTHFEFDALCLIADENTYKAAGQRVEGILRDTGLNIAGVHIFPGEPRLYADYDHIRFLLKWIPSLDSYPRIVPVVVGAGTLNDLVKRTATELTLPYFCVPTAASVDGFTPSGASLLVDGFKQTLPCSAPRALAADTDVIADAPAYLSSSGFGDLASKIIAGTDWIIAEKAGSLGAPEAPAIVQVCWDMVQNGLMDALNRSVTAAKGDRDAVKTLFEALAITGFAMQYMKNPRPVSGAEHLWSHVWEMEGLSVDNVPVTHGHKVGIGTLAATAFTEIFFMDPNGPPPVPKTYKRPNRDERKAEVEAIFRSSRACNKVVEADMSKFMDEKTVNAINDAFRDSWKEIRGRVLERLMPYSELKAILLKAGCPVTPGEIGLGRSEAIYTARRAQMIRNKYSILDLYWDMGNFESILAKIEAADYL